MEKHTFTICQTLNRDQIVLVIRTWYEVLQRQRRKRTRSVDNYTFSLVLDTTRLTGNVIRRGCGKGNRRMHKEHDKKSEDKKDEKLKYGNTNAMRVNVVAT